MGAMKAKELVWLAAGALIGSTVSAMVLAFRPPPVVVVEKAVPMPAMVAEDARGAAPSPFRLGTPDRVEAPEIKD